MKRKPILGTAVAIAVGAALLPLGTSQAAAATSGEGDRAERAPAGSAPRGTTITSDMRKEITDTVEQGSRSQRTLEPREVSASRLAESQIRCMKLEGERYCLHVGWTNRTRKQIVRQAAEASRESENARADFRTGDVELVQGMREHARLTPDEQKAVETEELESAAAGLAKIVELRHNLESKPVPKGFYDRHPESRTTAQRSVAVRKYPSSYTILKAERIREQHRKYWCGPTAMQSIGWSWNKRKRTQKTWANRLGTTSSGTSIWQMVKTVNRYTGWDREKRAGKYITLDISDYSYGKWYQLNRRHYYKYRAPIVLHPQLLKKYYRYLDRDGSGHFQVGRGYRNRKGKVNQISYFEPWNPHYFNRNRKNISRVHRNSARRQYKANLANSFQNIGV